MGWLKNIFEGLSMPDYDKMLQDRLAREQKEREEIFDISQNIDQIKERTENDAVEYELEQKEKREQEVEEERKKEEKASDSLKLVLDTAKLQCDLCTNPIGDLKVNYDTPTIQGKKTATVVEKDMRSLIFKGNCVKSPMSASPCPSVMQLGDWKDVGNIKVQEQFPLLLKSTIKCNYGGVDVKIIDCAQRNEPSEIEAVPKEPKKKKILSAVWMCDEMKEVIDRRPSGQKVSILAKTQNYEEGETLFLEILESDKKDMETIRKKIIVTGRVKADGSVELREELEKVYN